MYIEYSEPRAVDDVIAASLPPRAREVFDLLLGPLPQVKIGKRLGIAPGTLKGHLEYLCQRFDCTGRIGLMARFVAAPAPSKRRT